MSVININGIDVGDIVNKLIDEEEQFLDKDGHPLSGPAKVAAQRAAQDAWRSAEADQWAAEVAERREREQQEREDAREAMTAADAIAAARAYRI